MKDITLSELEQLDVKELHQLWQECFETTPAQRLSQKLIIQILGFHLQSQQHDGLSKTAKRQYAAYEKQLSSKGKLKAVPAHQIKSGTKLVREWNNQIHTVLVQEKGYEYANQIYPSLSAIAKQITGAHWSGPRFFGLNG